MNFNPLDLPAPIYVIGCILITLTFVFVLRKIEEHL